MIKLIKTEHIHNSVNSFYIGINLPCKTERFESNILVYNVIDAGLVRITNKYGVQWKVEISNGNYLRITEDFRIEMLNKEYNKFLRLEKLERIIDE